MAVPAMIRMSVVAGACFASAAGASELAPDEIVARYLLLVDSKPDQAKTLLAADAAFMIFDLAGPLGESFPEFAKQLSAPECSKPILTTEGKFTGHAGIDAEIVRVDWRCTVSTDETPASTTARFYTGNQKILGVTIDDPVGYRGFISPL